MKPVIIHADGTDCGHEGMPQAMSYDAGGPQCPGGLRITRIRVVDGRELPIGEAAALLTEFGRAFTAAFQSIAEGLQLFAVGVAAWAERNRPVLEALGKVAQDPRVQAYLEARRRGEIPAPGSPGCHCLCARRHPGDTGICDGNAVAVRRFESAVTGPVDVQLCAPCMAAQGIAELEETA